MHTNDAGHAINNQGITTTPHKSPFWVGEGDHRIAFDYLVLENDRVALHALYGDVVRQCHSDFFYDVVETDNVLESARNLAKAAISAIQAYDLDIELYTDRVDDFISAIASEIKPSATIH